MFFLPVIVFPAIIIIIILCAYHSPSPKYGIVGEYESLLCKSLTFTKWGDACQPCERMKDIFDKERA